MPVFASLTFQGEPELSARLSAEHHSELRHEAFPRSPPRGATADPGYQAFKLHPMADGHLLISSVRNAGDRDRLGRPVLRAQALLLQPEELAGDLRDIGATWRALLGARDLEGFAEALATRSALTDQVAFQRMIDRMAGEPEPIAALAAQLGLGALDLHLDPGADVPATLGPALLLVPVPRLCRIQLCSGAVPGEARERVLVLTEPPPRERGGLLRGLSASWRNTRNTLVYSRPGPVDPAGLALVEAVCSPEPWPLVPDQERLRILVEAIDGTGPRSLWEAAAELRALRRALKRVSAAEQALRDWR